MTRFQSKIFRLSPGHARPRHAIAVRARPSQATPHHILLIIRRAELAAYRKGVAK
jgi:hypothetical protein